MPELNVSCYKGTNPGDNKRFNFDPMLKLSEVRKRLKTDGFLPDDNAPSDIAYRFIAAQSESSEMSDALINKSVENLVPLAGVLGKQNQLLTTNYLARRKPDLIGIGTDWFFNRYVGVNISLNNGDPEGKKTNDRIKAFRPLMLTNVKPTSQNVVGIWDNVCVCVENSVVSFSINSWGAAGFQYYIAPDQGDPICNGDLNICLWDQPNRYASAYMARYASKPQTIQIVSAKSQQITGGEILRFQKVTVKTRRIKGYSQDGKRYASNQTPPTRSGPAGLEGFNAELADAASDLNNQKALVKAPGIVTVPGDSVTPGGPVAGPPSQQQWGKPIYDIDVDDWSQALGEVVIYFFVFESWEKANAVINGYNAPDPTLWT
jgi:hypothetical protein